MPLWVYNIRKDHLVLIAWTHIRYSFRGASGLVFVLFALVGGLMIASMLIDPIEKLQEQTGNSSEELIQQFVVEIGRPALKWSLNADEQQTEYLLMQKPAIVSAFLLMLMLGLPFIVSLGSFNQLSGDIGNKGLRYLLLRTERINLFLGRFIGTYLLNLVVFFSLIVIVLLYLIFKAGFYPTGEVVYWMLQGFTNIGIYALPYVALCAWISAAIDSPFGSLVLGLLIIGIWPIFVALAQKASPHAQYMNYVMPWGYKYWLLHPQTARWLLGMTVMLGFTAVFLLLGIRHFQKRDV